MDAERFIRAILAQRRLMGATSGLEGLRGIGIGLTEDRADYALQVHVDRQSAADSLPAVFDGFQVIALRIGPVRAL